MYKIVYHGTNCNDGFGSMLVVYDALVNKGISPNDIDTYAANYFDPIPWDWYNSDDIVYMVDFSHKRENLIKLNSMVKKLVVLDHHETAENELKDLSYCIFSKTKSGVGVSWEYFNPDVPMPLFYKYIQDRDLWKFELDYSREFHAGLASYDKDIKVWKSFMFNTQKLIEEGTSILRYVNNSVKVIALKARMMENLPIVAVNSPVYQSELGEYMLSLERYKGAKMAAIWDIQGDKLMVSLRSRNGEHVNCGEFAKQYGGGGHVHSAGMIFDLKNPFEELFSVIKE